MVYLRPDPRYVATGRVRDNQLSQRSGSHRRIGEFNGFRLVCEL